MSPPRNTPMATVEFDPATSLPKRIEHFAIIELLGQGAMGFVFRARDEKFQIDVALKMVKPELATEASARERFLREARAAAALSHHDHIVPVQALPRIDTKWKSEPRDQQQITTWIDTLKKTVDPQTQFR